MPGKQTIQPDDDDLIVDLEDAPQDFAPSEPEPVEEARSRTPEAPTTPDEEERETIVDDDEAPVHAKKEEDEEPAVEDLPSFDDAHEVRAQLEAQLREERANGIWQTAQANAAVVETRRDAAKVAIDTLNFRLEKAHELYDAAKEAGAPSSDLSRISNDIRTMEQVRSETQAALGQMPTREQVLEDGQNKARQALAAGASTGKKVGAGINALHPLAERWASGNGWMKTNSRANQYVLAQSQKMAKAGNWDPDSPGFYTELGRRVALAFPNLAVKDLQARQRAPGKGNMRSPVAPTRSSTGNGGAARQVNGKTRYTITASEQATMKRFKLDPSKPEHRTAWAKVRLQRAQREQREGAR